VTTWTGLTVCNFWICLCDCAIRFWNCSDRVELYVFFFYFTTSTKI